MTVIDEIKESLDITDFVRRYVELQKSGRYFKGLCPFHTEKTPSFYVFPDNQRWHCFGCNRGGDVFNFVMEHEGMDFRGALEELARQTGVQLRERSPQEMQAESEADRLRSLLEDATEYYHALLLSAPQAAGARAYLRDRGFKMSTVETFRLGYAMESWDAARTHLMGKGYSVEELVTAGMSIERDQGSTYDRFRNRVMIPIRDRRGRVIAFGARALADDQQPKYLNSPQSPVFDKGSVLFGYDTASRAIRQADAAIIVEGYMDVMIPHQAGFKNIVAPMGTALSEAHLKQLQRLTDRYILALDPDAAGIHGTLQGLDTARQTLDRDWDAVFDARGLIGYEGRLKADIRVITMPDGLDPDELVLGDPERWERLIDSSQPVVRFYFQHMLSQGDIGEPKFKARVVDEMLPLLKDVPDAIEREAYTQEIATTLGLDQRTLLDRLRALDRTEAIRTQAAVRSTRETRAPSDLETHTLTVLMHYPDLLANINAQLAEVNLEALDDADFAPQYRLVWTSWTQMREHPELELEDFLPSDMLGLVQAWMGEILPEMSLPQWERDLVRTVLRMRLARVREDLRESQMMLRSAQAEGDTDAIASSKSRVVSITERLLRIQSALAQRPI